MQENIRKRDDAGLQLWEVTSPRQRQNRNAGTRRPVQYRNTETGRPVQSISRRRAKRRRAIRNRCIALAVFVLFLVGIFQLTGVIYRGVHAWIQTGEISASGQDEEQDTAQTDNPIEKPYITVNLLEQNRYSRPGTELKKVKNVFVHYTANKGTTAEQNRSYFANLAKKGERSASAHFIIG